MGWHPWELPNSWRFSQQWQGSSQMDEPPIGKLRPTTHGLPWCFCNWSIGIDIQDAIDDIVSAVSPCFNYQWPQNISIFKERNQIPWVPWISTNSGTCKIYPLVICYIAIENDPVEIVDFPIQKGGSFQFAMLVITREYPPLAIGFEVHKINCGCAPAVQWPPARRAKSWGKQSRNH